MRTLVAGLGLALVAGLLAGGSVPAKADDIFKTTNCPTIAGRQWVVPNGPYMAGTRYLIITGGTGISCSQATTWAKKLMLEQYHGPVVGQFTLKGGPAGFNCTSGIDKNGYAYQGTCHSKNKNLSPWFSWGSAPGK